ncbi:MAG: SURF1-like protein [Silanimonas sp.]|nr:MAG: SURF1-like protein [Silanimonas sp.]
MKRSSRLVLRWVLVLALVALFLRAGVWQMGRAEEKQARLDRAAAVLARREPLPLSQALAAMPAWVEFEAAFEPHPALRLDQQRRGGRVGVQVYRLARLADGHRLWVDIGWQPLPADRTVPIEPALPDGALHLAGLLVPPPSAGLAIGPALSPLPDQGWLALRLDPEALRQAAAPHAQGLLEGVVLRLDPMLPFGHERDLDLLPNTLPPEKHRGYALQWFGFAAGLLLLSLYLQFRRP